MILDAITTIGGLIIPPVFNFIKKKFLTGSDDPEETLNTLALTKPEALSDYVTAQASLLDAQVKFFNRDVIGQVSQWVVDLRGSIRPVFVAYSLVAFFLEAKYGYKVDDGSRYMMEIAVSSWFGSRL